MVKRLQAAVRRCARALLVDEPMTPARIAALYPSAAQELARLGALQASPEAVRMERERIRGVYEHSMTRVDPLIERLMFDGVTQPETAAMAWIAHERTRMSVEAEAMAQRTSGMLQ